MYAGAALIGVLAAAVAIPVFALGQGGSGGGLTVEGNAVAEIDPSANEVVGQVPNVGARPGSIAYGSGSLWVANLDDQTVTRIDPATRSVKRNLPVEDTPTGLATSPGAVWVVGSDPTRPSVSVRRIDPQFNDVAQTTRIGNVVPGGPGSVATLGDVVWVAPSSGLLSRVSSRTARVVEQVDPNVGPTAVAVSPDAVWVTDSFANNVLRIDRATSLVAGATPVGNGPSAIAVGAGAIWVADSLDDAVVRIDPGTRAVTTTISVGRGPTGVAVGGGAVWVANSRDGTVSRIDPETNRVTKTIRVGGSPQGITVGAGRVWTTVQTAAPSPTGVAVAGGVARINAEQPIDFVDPALAYTGSGWSIEYATCAKLFNYPDKAGPAGSRPEPELATAEPARSADGRTYTFTIRPGFRFSPPSNEPVTAETFRHAIERTLSAKIDPPARQYAGDIVGAGAYEAGTAKHITGVSARGSTLTIRLTHVSPDLPTRLALPFFCAVPLATPVDPKGVRAIPSAGPYYVASYTPGQGVVLKRNPNYHGSRPHHIQEIVYGFGVGQAQSVKEIEAGQADFAADGVPPEAAARLAARYGPGSSAAKKGRQRYFANLLPSLTYLALNTSRPLFSDVKLRRAVNYAIDRKAASRIAGFGIASATPTDQYLPPGMPGFHDAHIYPFTPDLAKARRLAHGRGGHAVLYTCSGPKCQQLSQVVQANLRAIGIDVEIKSFSLDQLFHRIGRKGEPFDIATVGWFADYQDPANFLNVLFDGSLLSATNNNNVSYFDDPSYNRKLAAAARLSGARRYLAYGALDVDLARNAAPAVALTNGSEQDFFSARMGCQIFQPIYGIDLAALCLRR